MKKLLLLLCLSFIGLSSYSQNLSFTKGIAPGKITNNRQYEDFFGKAITVVDEKGVEYTFVKATVTVKPKEGKAITVLMDEAFFPRTQLREIGMASAPGTVYTFTNVVVKNEAGKEFKLSSVKYEYAIGDSK